MQQHYRQAWEAVGRLPNGDALRAEWFSQGVWVVTSSASSAVVSTDPNAPWGSVEIAFRADGLGRARKIEVVGSEPPELLDKLAERRLSEMRLRPRIVDGRIVAWDGSVILHFQYDPAAVTGRGAR